MSDRPSTVSALLARAAVSNPHGPAIHDGEHSMSFGERWEREIARNIELDAPYR